MKSDATFGIVTPSFNQASYIRETIQSVLSQGNELNVQYVVMDGGSTDNSVNIIKEYEKSLYSWTSEKDEGQADAIVKGFQKLDCDYYAYLNSDDVLLPGALKKVKIFFENNPKVDFIYSHRVMINEKSEVIGFWILPPHNNYLMKRWDLVPQETLFWRKNVIESVGGIDPSFKFAMDYDFLVRLMSAHRGKRYNDFLGAFRLHSDSKTQTQLHTVGMEEIGRIWSKYELTGHQLVGEIFQGYVKLSSKLSWKGGFKRSGKRITIGKKLKLDS